ncbi:hypothetical protein CGMCC3_g17543 [Colletotrichum fructicola]|nr:uncharacterized protein CGMCC3_g17543 [Colletotrichum fructicola]KAE9566294.1 hypothetical protein CGMCC3_g17543 [Colletotrichum fructicola]
MECIPEIGPTGVQALPTLAKPCVPVLYLVDGNSVFLTALESLDRRLSLILQSFSDGVIVAIGYPLSPDSRTVMCLRRTTNLTPPAEGTFALEGGADAFLNLIQDKVKYPVVERRLRETRGATIGIPGESEVKTIVITKR